jgi:hypothetical protein
MIIIILIAWIVALILTLFADVGIYAVSGAVTVSVFSMCLLRGDYCETEYKK